MFFRHPQQSVLPDPVFVYRLGFLILLWILFWSMLESNQFFCYSFPMSSPLKVSKNLSYNKKMVGVDARPPQDRTSSLLHAWNASITTWSIWFLDSWSGESQGDQTSKSSITNYHIMRSCKAYQNPMLQLVSCRLSRATVAPVMSFLSTLALKSKRRILMSWEG